MHEISRREFLRASALAAAGLTAIACQPQTVVVKETVPVKETVVVEKQQTVVVKETVVVEKEKTVVVEVAPAEEKEAPQLVEMVKAGTIPPLAERLPDDPLVVPVVERLGKYGGTWRGAIQGGNWIFTWLRTGYENLLRWNPEWTEITPNIAQSFEAGADATEYTFNLRRGIKLSNSEPFTADDILFWYQDYLLNPELTPAVPGWLVAGGEPVVVEKLDDYSVKFKFAAPNGFVLQRLCTPLGGDNCCTLPAHYMKQFHQAYNKENLDELIKENEADDWVSLFMNKGIEFNASRTNTELPVPFAWGVTTPYGKGPFVAFERNPYYWKVDPEGNQLPYIDEHTADVHEDSEVMLLKSASGEYHLTDRQICAPANKAVFIDNMGKGNYHLIDVTSSKTNTMCLSFNLTHSDPVMREVFQNIDFRIGLSHAMNRQEIIDVVYVGQGEPFQGCPARGSEFYNERLATQYTEYDVDKANEYLDKVIPDKDAEGYRLRPDGQRLSFVVEASEAATGGVAMIDALQLVQANWKEVGVDMQVKVEDRSLFYTRKGGNEHDANVWSGDGGLGWEAILDPRWYLPASSESNYGLLWYYWYQGDPRGEAPPQDVQDHLKMYDQLKAMGDPEKQKEMMKQILEVSADQFYCLGLSSSPPGYQTVRNDIHNVPNGLAIAWLYPDPACWNPCQFFIE